MAIAVIETRVVGEASSFHVAPASSLRKMRPASAPA